jgi:hypothetical protein
MVLSSGRAGHRGDRVFRFGETPRCAEEGIADRLIEIAGGSLPFSAMDTATPRP